MIRLYDSALSGNCHKVRMMLGFLGLNYEKVDMNWARGDQYQDWFRALNPRAQLPALDDAGTLIWDSQAILVYLSRTYGGEKWCPVEATALTRIIQWMMLANEEIRSLAWARVTVRMKRPREGLAELQRSGCAGLATLELRLKENPWVALDEISIADIACFPYAALAPEGEVSLEPFPAVKDWVARIKSLPGYVPMPGLE